MPKAAKKSLQGTQNLPSEDVEIPESQEDSTSSDQETEAEVSFHLYRVPPAHPVHQVIPSMCMPYSEGPKWIGLLMMGYTTTSSNGD